MITKIADFISGCPYLEGAYARVNCLDREVGSVSVEMTKNKRSVREYADGGGLEALTFVIALREGFDVGEAENRRIAEKCSLFEKWIEEQNINGCLPEFEDGRTVASVGLSSCFELARTDNISARYEAEIEVIYYTNKTG